MGFSGTRLLFLLLFPLFSFVVPYGKGLEWQGEVAGEPNTEDLGAVPVSGEQPPPPPPQGREGAECHRRGASRWPGSSECFGRRPPRDLGTPNTSLSSFPASGSQSG
ncbi:hypothetical protein BHE74_00059170 [Ensete ventricosum]|nr:hypothetical protein BHE74_00059170 [Ensete ventricosum]